MAAFHPTPVLIAALALGAGALAGCGGGDNQPDGSASEGAPQQIVAGGGGGNELSASDTASVLGAYRTIGRACSGDPRSRSQVPQAVRTVDAVATQYPTRTWEVGSADRATVMYQLTDQLAGILRQCGLPGSDVLHRRAEIARGEA